MSSNLSNVNKLLLRKLSIMLISSGLLILALFLILFVIFELSNIQFILIFYLLGILAVFTLVLGLISLLKFRSFEAENVGTSESERTTKRDFLTRIGISQILFGLALIVIIHSPVSIIMGLFIIILAAYYIFFRK